MDSKFDRPTDFNNMYMEEPQPQKKSSFDFVLWFFRIIKYWYLFVISLALFLGYAYLKNKSWVPVYLTGGVLMLEARGSNGVAMNSVPLSSMVRNSVNQQMLLTSYDMVVRTVVRLPQMRIDYFIKNRFKAENLYGRTPVNIEVKSLSPEAYKYVFEIEPINAEKCRIFYDGSEETPPFSMEVPYGKFVQEKRFFIRINKNPNRFISNFQPFNFRFISTQELTNRFSGRVRTSMKEDASSALSISMTGTNPNQDVDFLQELLKVYEEYNLTLKNEAADQAINFMDKQIKIISDSLYSSENQFRNFQEVTGMYTIDNTDIRAQQNEINKSLGEIKAQEDMVLLLTEDISNAISQNIELSDPSSLGITDSNISNSINEYNTLVSKVSNIAEAHPMYDKSMKSLNDLKIKILEELRNIQNKIQKQKEALMSEGKQIETDIYTLPAQEREFTRFQKNYQVNEAYFNYLRQKKYEANIQKASNIPDNYVMEEPRLLSGPINAEEKKNNYTFFLAIALILPIVFIYCKEELFNYSISTKEECERISGLPVIATIENIAKKMNSASATLVKNFPKSSFAESFRNLRIRIEYMAQKESGISVLLTSAEPADGKTFIAANIASVYQLTGKKVILVDFDLRRPAVSKLLKIDNKKGISNYLIGQVAVEDIIITHPEYDFDVLTAGTLPPNPSELIKTKRTKELIEYLHKKYDYVIVDCSPVGLVSDAYILSRYVDTTLFVVRRAKTNKLFFKSVITQLKNDGINHNAIIFNDVKGREGYYGTSRYYGDRSYYLKANTYYHDDYFEK